MADRNNHRPVATKTARRRESLLFTESMAGVRVGEQFDSANDVSLFHGDCRELFRQNPAGKADLIVTSPPYNLGKEYEQTLDLTSYLAQRAVVIQECVRILSSRGNLCWQVGNYVSSGSILPLDAVLYPIFTAQGLRMRNRIVWHFEHGLHCSRRFSGRYEVIAWFTKSDEYVFHLDPVRVPQKYPSKKHFKGPKAGQYSCNPLGKNPGDVWAIPNVKHNHIEKTCHPCQFPVELVERLVLSLTDESSLVVDPFMGVGSTAVAAIRHGRKVAGAELQATYLEIARERVLLEAKGMLRTRPMGRAVYEPSGKQQGNQRPVLFARQKGGLP
jgi:adenine-specific DNA-methyltransferase